MKQPLTNKEGEVRELTPEDFKTMRSMHEILHFNRVFDSCATH